MKRIQKSGRKKNDFSAVKSVIDTLAIPEILPQKNKDHILTGNYDGFRECHILPDLLLIYNYDEQEKILYLYRIGSHSELF